jgi:twitching motility two-component system response regulator PilH
MTIKRVLIVDDSPTERHVLNDMLTKAGYEVVASDNGEDAILKARTAKPDLILMDIVMPGLNGFQATRAISRDPQTRSVPIIICTSKTQETDKIWGMRQGARDYIMKPVRREELLAKITASASLSLMARRAALVSVRSSRNWRRGSPPRPPHRWSSRDSGWTAPARADPPRRCR